MQTILFYFINIVGISQILSYVRRKSYPWLGKKINHTTTNTTICGGCKQFYCKFSTTFLFLIFQISLLKSTSNLNILTSLFPTKTKEKKKRKKRSSNIKKHTNHKTPTTKWNSILGVHPNVKSPKPNRMQDHMVNIKPLWRSVHEKVPLHKLHPPLHPYVLSWRYTHKDVLQFGYVLQSYTNRECLPIQHVTEW